MGNTKALAWTAFSDPCGGLSTCSGVPSDSGNPPACAWSYVSCMDARIIAIDASCTKCAGMSRGQLPRSLAYLDALTSLNVSSNSITGGLPSNWAALTSLQILDVSYNQFGSNLPGVEFSVPASQPGLWLRFPHTFPPYIFIDSNSVSC